MLADRVRMSQQFKVEDVVSDIYLAQDSDFDFDGYDFTYVGDELEIEIPHVIHGVAVDSYDYMFSESYGASPVTKVVSTNSNIVSMAGIFTGSTMLSLDLSNFDTSNVTSTNRMFYNCRALTSLDLSSFDTSNATSMSFMFYNCRALTSLDLSSFDTSNVTSMSFIFYNCNSVAESYARTQADADKFNSSDGKSSNVNFVVK